MKQCRPCVSIRTFFTLLKKHYQAFRKELQSHSLIGYSACEIKYNKKKLSLYNSWPVIDTRNKATVMYDKKAAEKLRYEISEEIKKEKKNA